MTLRSIISATLFFLMLGGPSYAQRTEVAIALSEHFFDAAISALFDAGGPPEFSLASAGGTGRLSDGEFVNALFSSAQHNQDFSCRESIRLQREVSGVRTAIRFREGRITAPLAFNGSYHPPLVGCLDFAGVADTVIDLEFDQANQRLAARARVENVRLNGTGGVGGNLIARLVQNSIDKKINPIELIRLDRLSFGLPIQNGANLQIRAVGFRHEIRESVLLLQVAYEFAKGP